MGLADDITNDLEDRPEIRYEDTAEKTKYVEDVKDDEDEEDDEEEVEKKIDIKQIGFIIAIVVAAYAIILQYKFTDKFLEMYLQNIPMTTKRLVLFASVAVMAYISSSAL